MNQTSMKPNTLRLLWKRQAGSAILAALGILAVTSAVVGAALFEARSRFLTSHHSSRWVQAAHAAEAGAELALLSAQNNSWITNPTVADRWPSTPSSTPMAKTFTLSTGVAASGAVRANVSVDTVTLSGSEWLRIRSTGEADLFGGASSGRDTRDVLLRKLSLRRDRSSGASVGTTPRATRLIEVLAEPVTTSPFKWAVLLNNRFSMSGASTIDSYDSSDPAKSTGGVYDAAKRQSNADIVINDTQGTSTLGNNPVRGDLSYTGAAPAGTGNVTGTITTPYSSPVSAVLAPTWTTFNATPTVINNSMTLTGGTQASPAKYKVSSLNLSGNRTLTMAPHATGAQSYIEVWVAGDFSTSGNSTILQQPGVHVTYHVAGNVSVTGSTFNNQSNIPANNILNVLTPAAGVPQTVSVTGNGTFIGAINAPGANFTLSGSGSFSGALIGKTMTISGSADLHYDEALALLKTNPNGYRVSSYVEAVR